MTDITKARRLVELTKQDKRIVVTLWESGLISSCATEAERVQHCETCPGDDDLCQEWLDHLKDKGYEATEVEVGELEPEESLPRFLEERGGSHPIEEE